MTRPALVLIAHGLLAAAVALANAEETSRSKSMKLGELGYTVKSWSQEDGVPANYVASITQTLDGYLWWESKWGMLRFDGVQAKPFPVPVSPEGGRRAQHVFCDSSGRLWFARDRNAGFVKGARLQWHTPLSGDLAGRGGMVEDARGRVWAHVTFGEEPGLIRLDESGGTNVIAGGSVRPPVKFDFSGEEVWASGLYGVRAIHPKLSSDLEVPKELQGLGQTGEFFRLHDGSLAVASREGIFARRNGKWLLIQEFSSKLKMRLDGYPAVVDGDGNYWIAATDGSLWLSLKGGRTVAVNLPDYLENQEFGIQAMLCDSENNLWLGTRDRIYQIHRTIFVQPLDLSPLGQSDLVEVQFDGSGGLWGIDQGSPGALWHYANESSVPSKIEGVARQRRVAIDAEGRVWTANHSELSQLHRDGVIKKIPYTEPRALYSLEPLDGNVWLGTEKGVFVYDGNELRALDSPTGLQAVRSHLVTDAQRGLVWVHQAGNGFHRRVEKRWDQLSIPQWALQHLPNGMHLDPEGHLWSYGTGVALMRYDGSKWSQVMNLKSGIPVEILDVASDWLGNLWCLTRANGVARIDRGMGGETDRPIEWFGKVDGLPSAFGLGWGKGVNVSPDGRVWFCTDKGVAVVDPSQWESVRDSAPVPQVHIEEVQIDGHPVPVRPGIQLEVPSSGSRLEIHYTALGLKNAKENQFSYLLEGWDDHWVDVGARRVTWFQKLPPGDYRFRLRASNSDGQWNLEGATFDLAVLPAWWQRRSVRLGALIAMLATFVTALRLRLKHLRRERRLHDQFARQLIETQESERKRIASDLHDSLGQNLLLAKNQLYLVKQEQRDPVIMDKIDRSIDSVGSALEEARAISYQLRPLHLERLGLTKALKSLARQVSESTHAKIETDIGEIDGLLGKQSELMLYRMVQEALSNVIKHADASVIHLSGRARAGTHLLVEVKDDGRGFDVAATLEKGHGLGLQGFRERARLIGGRLDLQSIPGSGTSWRVEIPIQEDLA